MESDSKNTERQKHQFSADRPIGSREEDLLGRASFADSLAAAIKGWKGNDSLVIALYGPWGSGKSSVKNMVLQSLRSAEVDSPLIVEFNPWQWSGQNQLVKVFLREIGLILARSDGSEDGKLRTAKWRTCGTDSTDCANPRAELEALFAHLFGHTQEEFACILTTFPLVPEPVKIAALNAYRDVERGLLT